MATNQLSGLVSGFDWKSFIDSTIEYSSAPITRIQKEQTANSAKITALGGLDSKLTVLQSALNALASPASFQTRTASFSTATTSWTASTSSGAALGAYKFDVAQLATASRLRGASDISKGISATDDVSATTLSTLSLATPLKAGYFTVNGQRVTIDLADSLEEVFTAISSATGGAVTASYSAAADKVTLSSTSPVVLGASNDTSNFLSAFRLANNGTGTVASSSVLGTLPLSSPLASAGLRTAVTAVNGSGDGTFNLNGVDIAYNVNTDSLKTVLARINASAAGVSASYDSAADRVVLTNKNTGDTGIFLSETAGGLLAALGLDGSSVERGKNALFTVNDGPALVSASNVLTSSVHGVEGLDLTVGSTGMNTLTVSADTAAMKSRVNNFITAFNDVQRLIEDQTKITTANGKVTAATLSSEREVSAWSQTLRRNAFNGVTGLSGAISRLEALGIDFTSGTNELSLKKPSVLDAALAASPDDVAAFFTDATAGFATRMKTAVDKIAGTDLAKGAIDDRTTKLTATNKSLDDQIAAIQRQLDQQRELLTASFVAMEKSQQTWNSVQSQITKSFFSNSK